MTRRLLASLAFCLALAGCAGHRDRVRLALQAPPAIPAHDLHQLYFRRCPDLLAVPVGGLTARYEVGPDGRIPLGMYVAGLTAPDASALIARELHLPEDHVGVTVAEYRSQSLYLVGEVASERQVV